MTANATARGWATPSPKFQSANIVRLNVAGISLYVHRDVSYIFACLVSDIDTVLRRKGKSLVKEKDDWSYARRFIAGTRVWSNHAWGLAVDLNALRNPQARKLITELDSKWVQWLLIGKYKGLIKWGGFYGGTTKKDPMHFEFMGTPAQARQLVAELKKRNAPAPAKVTVAKPAARSNPYAKPNFAVPFGIGAKGSKVQWVQWALGITTDGDFGPKTRTALIGFQRLHGLKSDGIFGKNTGAKLALVKR
jgi:peptidoglycan hydrolase-like protein with peptidoglycan-binding domain